MASSEKTAAASWPKVTSQYHRERSCAACFLCGKKQARYDHFNGLAEEVRHYIQNYSTSSIPGDSCICRNHRIEAKRNLNNTQHIPTWKERGKENVTGCIEAVHCKCTYPECSTTSQNARIIIPIDRETFCNALGNCSDNVPVAVYKVHYQRIYRQIYQHHPCAGCDAKPKAREGPYTRHSPDALTVCQYLNERTEFEVNLTQEDILCKSCYNTHLVIVQHLEQQDSTPNLDSDVTT